MEKRLQELNNSIILELIKAMGLPQSAITQRIVRTVFGKASFRFSELLLRFDYEVSQNGSIGGTRWLLPHFVADYEACGTEIIPKSGPLIIASNHPASYDGIVITAHIPRPDYKIIIGRIPPYLYLPHLSQHVIFSPPAQNTFGRMQTVRETIQHLKNGGALLIFPRGGIEPDPAFMPNPDAEFSKWSRSLEIFIRSVPQTQVLITTVSGVISKKIMAHPITALRKFREDKQRMAFIYQLTRQTLSGKELFGLTPRVTFGELLASTNQQNLLAEIEQSARRTLAKHLSIYYP